MRRRAAVAPSISGIWARTVGALGHVLGVVADALEVARDLHHRQDQPQIDGGGRAQGDDAGGVFVDLFFERIDGLVALADLFGQFLVAALERGGCVPDGLFDQPAHFHDLGLDRLEIAIEGRGDVLFFVHGVVLSRSGR